jgi:hypothetical protein
VGLAVQLNDISFRYFKELLDTNGDRGLMDIVYNKYKHYIDEISEMYIH